ncbi:hypothetical protein Bbelb_264960 [Branchiostoma belcheri]|nr:hypothetical protein Bbelb_264960 [Branchiostoma belcheri]
MGLSDGSVPSSQLSASSSIDLFPPGNGRVNFTTGGITGWIPDSEEWLKFDTTAESDVFTLMEDEEPPYLEADFGSPQELTGVITQGGGGGDISDNHICTWYNNHTWSDDHGCTRYHHYPWMGGTPGVTTTAAPGTTTTPGVGGTPGVTTTAAPGTTTTLGWEEHLE